MDVNENEAETDSDEEEDNEGGSSGSDDDESGDDDDDSDYESVEEEIIDTVSVEGAANADNLRSFSSDDDPERECCPICLNKFYGQDLGTPQSCDHTFCFECIKEWSKNINTCPIDRTQFNYIHVKTKPGGAILRKFEVKVAPREPENALDETPTLCEICQSGEREDRLLLCDGCDLAYHCECLDPPLFYIPIEEWFCPPCSGVFDSRAVAGPSRSGTRRIIPRTRASEAVRSRVQNRQMISTPRSSSIPKPRKTTTKTPPKKRKRRCYRKVIRKVVTLARTKKDMMGGQKGKLGARTSTVIVTYRRRGRRRKTRRKASKKSVASSKVTSIPSSKQRIARHLGMKKPLQGSTVPQIKKAAGSRSGSTGVASRLPAHSLFGNKDQLMDFSENFNEDARDTSSTSLSRSAKRSSVDARPSTSSCINILDSILAGQKILQAKPDKVLIKTDGSLILKDDVKTKNSERKIEKDLPSRTPMSIALAKPGVKISLSDKSLNASCKKHADTSKTKNVSGKIILKSRSDSLFENRSSINKVPSESSSKLSRLLTGDFNVYNGKERNSLSSTEKNNVGIKSKKVIASEDGDSNSFTELDGFASDSSSDVETTRTKNRKKTHLNDASERKSQNNLKFKNCKNSVQGKYQTAFDSLSNNFSTTLSPSSSAVSSRASTKTSIKRENLSNKEINNVSVTTCAKKFHIKKEILSDEEASIDSCNEQTSNKGQECNNIVENIKKEPIDIDLKANAIKDYKSLEVNRNILSESSHENDLSDSDASQSISDSVSCDVLNDSQANKLSKNSKLVKIKEEILSDTEDYSQSIILDKASENLSRLSELNTLLSIKKEPLDLIDDDKSSRKEKRCHQNKNTSFIEPLKSRSSALSSYLSKNQHNSSENELPFAQTAASLSNSDSEDDIPCAQTLPLIVSSDSEEDIPCTQAFPQNVSSDSDDDIPCTQAFPQIASSDSDNEMPCTQAFPQVPAIGSEDEDICSQKSPAAATDLKDDLPYTQAANFATVDPGAADNFPYTQAVSDGDIPCTQVAPASATAANFEENGDMAYSQAAFISSKNNNRKPITVSFFDSDEVNSCEIEDNLLPPTQYALCMSKNKDVGGQVPSTKTDFEFKKPSAVSTRKRVSGENNNKTNNSSKACFSEWELSSTQTFSASVNGNKDKFSNQLSNNLKSVKTANGRYSPDLDDVDDSNLPSTQVSISNSKRISDLFDIADGNSNLDLSARLATQTCNINSQNISEFAVPKTQNFKTTNQKKIFDLPPTQISNISSAGRNASYLDIDESCVLPSTQLLDTFTQENNSSSTHPKDNESYNLSGINLSDFEIIDNEKCPIPDTQVASPATQLRYLNSKMLETNGKNDGQDDDICKKNINEIISNIKLLVNNLSSKVSKTDNLQNISNEDSSDKLAPNYNNDRTSSSFIDPETTNESRNVSSEELKNVQPDNSEDVLSEIFKELSSAINTEKENQNSIHSFEDPDNEEFCLEKLKESLKNPKPVAAKKSGIHKHLPQVIAAVPIKENLRIKPSNKRTFSFEEVKKLEKPNILQKPSKNCSSNFETPDSKIIENSTNDLDDNLPATQAVETTNEKFRSSILPSQNNNLNGKNHIAIQTRNYLNVKQDSQSYGSFTQENDDFPATQVSTFQDKEKYSHLSTEKRSKCMNTITSSFQNIKCNAISLSDKEDSALPAINTSKKESMTSNLDLNESTDSSLDSIDPNDLPATQRCNNLPSTNLNRIQKHSNHNTEAACIEINQNSASKTNKKLENNCFKYDCTSKRKISSDEIIKNKKVCNQTKGGFHCSKKNVLNGQRVLNKCLESEHEYKKCKEVETVNCTENSFDASYKQKNLSCDKKFKPKKDIDHEKALSSDIIDLLKENFASNKISIKQEKSDFEFVKPPTNIQIFNQSTPVTCLNLNVIKTEKVVPSGDFLLPTQAVDFNHSEDDSLPQTQVTNTLVNINRNITEKDSRFIHNNFLSPSEVKKEPVLDDDEVSVIEINTSSNVKVKEEIILIDDDDDEKEGSNLLNFHTTKGKEIPSEILNVSCVKKEQFSNANVLSESELKAQSFNITNELSENSDRNCLKEYKSKSGDSAKSKNDCENHKHIELKKISAKSFISDKDTKSSKKPHISKEKVIQNLKDQNTYEEKSKRNSKDQNTPEKKSKRNSKDENISEKKSNRNSKDENISEKKSKRNSKDQNTHEEKSKRNSNDQITFDEKSKRNSRDHHVSKEKITISKNLVRDEKNSTLDDFPLHQEKELSKNSNLFKKKDNYSKDSKPSNTEVNSSYNSQRSQEKCRKELEDSCFSKEEIKMKSSDSLVSKKYNNKTGALKSQPKDNKYDAVSKEKVSKCGSLSKNTDYDTKHSKKSKDSVRKDSTKSTNDQYSENEAVKKKTENKKDKQFERENNKQSKKVEVAGKSDKSADKDESSSEKENRRKNNEIVLNNPTIDQYSENEAVKTEKNKDKHFERENNKHSNEVALERKSDKFFDKDRRSSSEKENRRKSNELIITLKSVSKRSCNDASDQYNQKKRKLSHSFDPISNSSEDITIPISDLQNGFFNYSNSNDNMQMECDDIFNRLSTSKDIVGANEKPSGLSKPSHATDIKKVHSKHDLKEEIANEVKLVLKPFYNAGLISKDDYKDIMRRAVPKIYMNCHHTINQEKIRKLVLNYVSLLNKS